MSLSLSKSSPGVALKLHTQREARSCPVLYLQLGWRCLEGRGSLGVRTEQGAAAPPLLRKGQGRAGHRGALGVGWLVGKGAVGGHPCWMLALVGPPHLHPHKSMAVFTLTDSWARR